MRFLDKMKDKAQCRRGDHRWSAWTYEAATGCEQVRRCEGACGIVERRMLHDWERADPATAGSEQAQRVCLRCGRLMHTHFILSLTTLPSRTVTINRVLESLCRQNYEHFEVHLNVPIKTRHDGEFDRSFKFLESDRLKVFFVEDVGAITKIYHTLARVTDPEQRIISVDDDFTYSPDMLAVYDRMLENAFQQDAIGFAGIWPVGKRSDGTLDFVGGLRPGSPARVGLLEGYKSVCYKRSHFSEEFFASWYKLHHEDDLVLSSWLGYQGVKKFCVPYERESVFVSRLLSFPLVATLPLPTSGVARERESAGSTAVSYKKFYNSEFGRYLAQ